MRIHSDDNVAKFKNSPSSVNWSEILDGVDANSDYDNLIKQFTEVYDECECIPLKKSKINRKTIPQSPWITKGLLKSINVKNKLYKQYLLRPTEDHLSRVQTIAGKKINHRR